MQTIGVIGGDGFIGSSITSALQATVIEQYNYADKLGVSFDVLINANGNSNKYLGNNNPVYDFRASVLSVYRSIFDFKYDIYVYVSSIDAEAATTPYGFHKRMAEDIVARYCDNYYIVRLPSVIGPGARKGVVNSILHGEPVYLTSDSTLLLLDVGVVAGCIGRLITDGPAPAVKRLYPSNGITIKRIGDVLKRDINYSDELRSEYYDYTGDLNSSEYYLNNSIYERMD